MRSRPTGEQRRGLLKPPPVLYHYTPTRGFIDILESQRLWAGDARQMNDADELVYARQVAARVAKKLLSDQSFAVATPGRLLLEDLANCSYKFWEWERYFVFCLSEASDQLSQWRAYANDGLGYAIGLRSSASFSTGFGRPVVLERVIYDAAEQDALLDELLRDAVRTAEEQGYDHFLEGLWEILAIIKNPAFIEEKEWRLIVQDWRGDGSGPRFHFTASRFGVAAKIEIGCVPKDYVPPFAVTPEGIRGVLPLPLIHVVAGPRVDDQNASFRLLEQCGYWPRYETLAEAVAAKDVVLSERFAASGVHVSKSAASYR
jgi:Protein of unknown function (DUF2971)